MEHLTALDGVRGVAILLVLAFHLLTPVAQGFGQNFAARLCQMGWVGVDLFFVLSGFLITGILLEARGSEHYFFNFYARRTVRIFPLYYAVLLGVFVILPLIGAAALLGEGGRLARQDQAWFWLYATNFRVARVDFVYRSLNHLWSLAVEEQFYLAWPFLVAWLSGSSLRRLCWFFIAAALAIRAGIIFDGRFPVAAYTLMPCRVDAFGCGALVALARRRGDIATTLWSSGRAWLALLAALILLFGVIQRPISTNPAIATAGYTLLALFFATSIAQVLSHPTGRASRVMSMRALTLCGTYSYALYMFHPMVHSAVHSTLARIGHFSPDSAPPLWELLASVLAIALSFALALLSWHLYEKHFLKLKRYVEYKGAKRHQAVFQGASEQAAAPVG